MKKKYYTPEIGAVIMNKSDLLTVSVVSKDTDIADTDWSGVEGGLS